MPDELGVGVVVVVVVVLCGVCAAAGCVALATGVDGLVGLSAHADTTSATAIALSACAAVNQRADPSAAEAAPLCCITTQRSRCLNAA